MKNYKLDEIAINISVIGLSGSENIKGIHGVGKSCLCNRLAQPNFYKHKHVSTISSIDFYGSIFNQSHWLYWNSICREIRGKKYKFRFVEQTIFIDDSSFLEFKTNIEPQDFIKRASMTELRVNKKAYMPNARSINGEHFSLNSEDKLHIHLFLLVFDVSDVEKRNGKHQEVIFKQLFNSVVAAKRPLIIVTTKNDIISPAIFEKFKTIVDKRPYNRYPIVETSAKLDINIQHIYEVAVNILDTSYKMGRQIWYTYSDGYHDHLTREEETRKQFVLFVRKVLTDVGILMPFKNLLLMSETNTFLERLSIDQLASLFAKTYQDFLLDQRASNNRRSKERLLQLLQQFDHLVPTETITMDAIMNNLTGDRSFMSHFIPFSGEMEFFNFDDHNCAGTQMLPMCLLDASYENNLLFFIEEFAIQKCLEYRLYNHLIDDSPKYFHKSLNDIRDYLTKYVKYFIQEKVIKNVYEKFRNHYLSVLHSKFVTILMENADLILSLNTFKCVDMSPQKSWTINGIATKVTSNLTRSSHERKSDDSLFLLKTIKEINKQIYFEDLPFAIDDQNIREEWIRQYLALFSKDSSGCIVETVLKEPCSCAIINNVLKTSYSNVTVTDPVFDDHVFYMTILGHSSIKDELRNLILSRSGNLPLKICKMHSSKYTMELIEDTKVLQGLINQLQSTNDRCSILCVVVLVDSMDEMESIVNELEPILSNAHSNVLLTKYLIYNIDCSKDNELISNPCLDLVERLKYTMLSWFSDGQHKTVDYIVSSAQKMCEPIIIWIVTVCGDQYNHDYMVKLISEPINSILLTSQSHLSTPSIIVGTTNRIIMQNYHLEFVPYHQVIKLMFQSTPFPTIDAMVFVCSLDRDSSLNTCLGIRKYLPADITSSCHFMMLTLGTKASLNHELAVIKSMKYQMEHSCYDTSANDDDTNDNTKTKLFLFFKGIIIDNGTLESFSSVNSNSSSLMNTLNKPNESIFRYLNKTLCQTCAEAHRSDVNVYANYSPKFIDILTTEIDSYTEVLGDINQNGFRLNSLESEFDEAQDYCPYKTEITCTIHPDIDLQPEKLCQNSPKSFRTRIRSQSGPDLRMPMDFNQTSQKYETRFYCSICGQDINKIQHNNSSRQSFRMSRPTATKETGPKTFTEKLHEFLHPIKKLSEAPSSDGRKPSLRTSSKRRK